MIAVHNFTQSEFRERVSEAILEMLAHLPGTQRNIFVWSHYRGYQPKQIAKILRCGASEVEASLDAINAILYQRTRTLLKQDLQRDSETGLPASNFQNSPTNCRFGKSPFDLPMELNR
jgi:DNA-directed RNA polymerase specialized sigma24 family protein